MLTEKEKHKYEVISKLIKNEITRKEAMYELNLSGKQITRLKQKLINEGKDGFVNKKRGKININKLDPDILEKVSQLYLTEYFDYNFTAFYDEINEKYKDYYDISYSSLYRMFLDCDIISPLAHKETLKVYNKKMENAINNEDSISKKEEYKELLETRKIQYERAHVRRSSNLYAFGQEIQMDACEKFWFGDISSHLHLAVDKGTKKILFGWFEYEELSRGYFVLLYNIIVNYGIPNRILTDNRTVFTNMYKDTETTQFGTICKELGIELKTTSKATAKANIERSNKTFKDRLIAELRHEGILDIDSANKYINEVFIPKMNRKFSYEINPKNSLMKENNYSVDELNLIISERYERIIDNGSSIKYNNKYFIPVDPITGEVTCFIKKTVCKLLITYNAELWCIIEDKYYILMEIEDRSIYMKKEDKKKPLEKKKYIPPANHPWRKMK